VPTPAISSHVTSRHLTTTSTRQLTTTSTRLHVTSRLHPLDYIHSSTSINRLIEIRYMSHTHTRRTHYTHRLVHIATHTDYTHTLHVYIAASQTQTDIHAYSLLAYTHTRTLTARARRRNSWKFLMPRRRGGASCHPPLSLSRFALSAQRHPSSCHAYVSRFALCAQRNTPMSPEFMSPEFMSRICTSHGTQMQVLCHRSNTDASAMSSLSTSARIRSFCALSAKVDPPLKESCRTYKWVMAQVRMDCGERRQWKRRCMEAGSRQVAKAKTDT